MRQRAVVCVALLSGGCGLAGSWKTVEVRPKGAAFPISAVTFDSKGQYTASGAFTAQADFDGNAHTTTGAYTQRFGTLRLSPVGGPVLEYKAHRRLDGKLVMTLRFPGKNGEVTAVLSEAKP